MKICLFDDPDLNGGCCSKAGSMKLGISSFITSFTPTSRRLSRLNLMGAS